VNGRTCKRFCVELPSVDYLHQWLTSQSWGLEFLWIHGLMQILRYA
jgi:hypothetical protein